VSRHKRRVATAARVGGAALTDISGGAEERFASWMTFIVAQNTGDALGAAHTEWPASARLDWRMGRLFPRKWAEATLRLMGRTPITWRALLPGYASVPEVFAKGGQIV